MLLSSSPLLIKTHVLLCYAIAGLLTEQLIATHIISSFFNSTTSSSAFSISSAVSTSCSFTASYLSSY